MLRDAAERVKLNMSLSGLGLNGGCFRLIVRTYVKQHRYTPRGDLHERPG
ncbi:hypothetical protein BCAR13_1060075 [Paraburkholderia caribensis]|nr:hypothetical protein BCAR13_1060075 [Paraburkholderia caribensis]